jgi:hypothetical protein
VSVKEFEMQIDIPITYLKLPAVEKVPVGVLDSKQSFITLYERGGLWTSVRL